MTIETKRKIIWWIKRILNYSECSDRAQYIVMDKRRVLLFQSRQMYSQREILEEGQLRYFANTQLISELEKNKVITYTKEEKDGNYVYTAKLKVVTP